MEVALSVVSEKSDKRMNTKRKECESGSELYVNHG
jgi:hypothetical protein